MFSKVFNKILDLVGRHTILSLLVVAAAMTLGIFGVIIGFIPIVVVIAPIAVIAWGIFSFFESRIDVSTRAGVRREARLIVAAIGAATIVTFGLIQLVPYGHTRTYNADTSGEPDWANDRTRELAVRACYDCHSDQPEYPSYASVAPISWAVQNHIDEGRESFNFSTFKSDGRGAREVLEVIQNGSMPPSYYTAFGKHPAAKLTAAEKQEFIQGLLATPGFKGSR